MISRDPRNVFVAEDQHEAAFVVSLLGEEGIEAQIVNDVTVDVLENITLPMAALQKMEVWVKDESQAAAGREILSCRAGEIRAAQATRESRTGNVDVVCPSCQQKNVVPAAQQGTVQTCAHCGEYLDIPDPDDATEWPDDFGRPEDDSEPDA